MAVLEVLTRFAIKEPGLVLAVIGIMLFLVVSQGLEWFTGPKE